MNNLDIFRPRSSVFAACIAYGAVLIMVVQTFMMSDLRGKILSLTWGIFASELIYMILHRPKVELFDEGIRIVNPFDEFITGWQLVEGIETKFTMSVTVANKNIYAWAAPAPGRYHSRSIHPSEIKGMDIGINGLIRPGESPRTHSGTAAYLASTRLKAFHSIENIEAIQSRIIFNNIGVITLICSFLLGVILNIYHL